jgi:WD40 repeat protein
VYGDCLQAEIIDFRSGKVVSTLHGHTDFGFSMAWHPAGNMIATGNQDLTCKIWDVRKLSKPNSDNISDPHCIKTLNCDIGSCSHIKFGGSGGNHLVFSENIDFV